MSITATYSPEDNKIRLYPSERLDAETFDRVKAAGFKWAPKQGLFVAPKWSTKREDLALELAGELEPEEMTLAERAEAKAERLEGIASNRARQASAFQSAAQSLSERFAMGQPILIGHHSERKARKDADRMDRAQSQAAAASDAVGYWLYRATGVERYANRKNDPKVRARRIKTLLTELRDAQRHINEAHKALAMWDKATTEKHIHLLAGSGIAPYGLWGELNAGTITPEDARARCIASATATANSPRLARFIAHTLNRLSYERELLGPVSRYSGQITPNILQMFVREHGADKPQAKKLEDDYFLVECGAPMPAHIANGDSAEMCADDWRDLMQSCGYEVPDKKPAKPPILNFKAPSGKVSIVNPWKREAEELPQVEMTAAEYAKVHSDQRGTRLSSCGGFRVRICPNRNHEGPRYSAGLAAVLISDQKPHPTPESVIDYYQAEQTGEAQQELAL